METPSAEQAPPADGADTSSAAAAAAERAAAAETASFPADGSLALAEMAGGAGFGDAAGMAPLDASALAEPEVMAPPSFWGGETVPDPLLALGSDAKTMLNTFCQRYTNKSTTKQCILYDAIKFGSHFQATVTLNCISGRTFAGALASNRKEAEQNAAKVCLDNFYWDIMNLPPPGFNKKKKGAASRGMQGWGAAVDFAEGMPGMPGTMPGLEGALAAGVPGAAGAVSQNNKTELNTALMRLLKRPLTKEDVTKNTVQTSLGYQCTISLPGMPGEWAGLAWAGEVAPNAKDAEDHAARYALEAINNDPTFQQLMQERPMKMQKTEMSTDMPGDGSDVFLGDWSSGWSGGFKGKGKGKKGFGKGKKGFGKGKGKFKGKGKNDYDGGWSPFPMALE